MSYFPLDRDVLSSSLWAQGTPEQVKVFVYLLLSANPRTGIVEDADPAIALRCGLPLDVTITALDWLASPDKHSRTKDHDGRRIERLAGGGVRVLNYLQRQIKDHSTPRVKRWRQRQRDARNAAKRVSTVTETTNKNKNKNKNTEGTEERIAEASPRAVEPARSKPPARTTGNGASKATASWSREACDDWMARYEGTAPGGRIGKALKPLVAKHGWPAVREAWRSYLEQADAEFASPQRFASTFGRWSGTAALPAAAKSTAADRTLDAARRFIEGGRP